MGGKTEAETTYVLKILQEGLFVLEYFYTLSILSLKVRQGGNRSGRAGGGLGRPLRAASSRAGRRPRGLGVGLCGKPSTLRSGKACGHVGGGRAAQAPRPRRPVVTGKAFAVRQDPQG